MDTSNSSLPPEYQAQLDAAKRKQFLAQLLTQRAMAYNGPQQGGRIMARTSPLAGLVNGLTGYLGIRGDNQATEDIAGVRKSYGDAETKAITDFQGLPPDQQQAAGQTSQFSRVRDIAKAMQAQNEKRLELGVGAVKDSDPAGALGMVQAGKIPEGYKVPPVPEPTFGTSPTGAGYVMAKNRKGEADVKFEPKGVAVTTNVGGEKQQVAAEKALGGEVPKILETTTANAKKAIDSIQTSDRIESLLKDPNTITGFGANTLSGLASIGTALGFQGPEAAGKTQSLLAELAGQTLNEVKRLPGAITEKERPFLEMAASGKVDWTPQAVQRLADLARVGAHNTLVESQKQYQGVLSTPGAEQGVNMYPFPTGWNFAADAKKYAPITPDNGMNPQKYKYIGDSAPAAPATPTAPNQKPLTIDQLTPAQKAQLMQMLGGAK